MYWETKSLQFPSKEKELLLRKVEITDYIKIEFKKTEDAHLLKEMILCMKDDFKGQVKMETLQAWDSEIYRTTTKVVNPLCS